MSFIHLDDQYEVWVQQNIVEVFSGKGIVVTTNAKKLLAFAMQSQVEENIMSQEKLFERANQVGGKNLLAYYEQRYGETEVNFNRAFHILDDLGFVIKFPFGPTVPSTFSPGGLGEDRGPEGVFA